MFVDEKTQGEVKPVQVGTLKFSTAVRIHGYGEPDDYKDCVLGRAYAAFHGHRKNEGKVSDMRNYRLAVAEDFGVPLQAADAAENMCMSGKSPSQIADWLESQGY